MDRTLQYRLRATTLALALVCATLALWAQAPVSIKIYATDGFGTDSITIGTHLLATGQIDTALGELELPPPPPSFDVRCMSLNGYDTLAGGTAINYHKHYTDTQTDEFRIAFQSDATGGDVVFTWPQGLGSVGAGYWHLRATDPNSFQIYDIDMARQTQFTMAGSASTLPQVLTIMKGDGKSFRTATYADLLAAKDYKLKVGKSEKAKPYASYGCFAFTNLTVNNKTAIHVEFSQNIKSMTVGNGWTVPVVFPAKKFDIQMGTGTPVTPLNNTIQICAYGDKGSVLKVSKWYWPDEPRVRQVAPLANPSQLLLRMPNYNNVGEELVKVNAWPELLTTGKAAGLRVGLNTRTGVDSRLHDIFKFVYHPKWMDVLKSLSYKTVPHSLAPHCLNIDGGLKPKAIVKAIKSAPSNKYNNLLIPELVTLKFNMAMNDLGKVEDALANRSANFSQMLYRAGGVPGDAVFDGYTVQQFAAAADSFLSCTTLYDSLLIFGVAQRINLSFNTPVFDTTSFGLETRLTAARAMAEQGTLYRNSLSGYASSPYPTFTRGQDVPETFELNQNYPNPFNPTTTIGFTLPADAIVTLKVYNLLGQEVATLADREEFTEGLNELTFDASPLATGIYYYRLVVNEGQFQQVKKMILLK